MPSLNVNPALASPFLCDRVAIRRRETLTNGKGRAKIEATVIPRVYGVVQADGDNANDRQTDYTVAGVTISFITKYRLRDQRSCDLPDIVLWRNGEFVVETLEDMTNFGPGFVEATCVSQKLQDAAPKEGSK